MSSVSAGRLGPGRLRIATLTLLVLSLGAIAPKCNQGGTAPSVHLTLNAVPDDMNSLLIVPQHGFVINVTFTQATSPIAPASFTLQAHRWGDPAPISITSITADTNGAVAALPESDALPEGTYTLFATVSDTIARTGVGAFSFAVRDIGPSPPIAGARVQMIYLNFDVDRDGDLAPDFWGDLQLYGLGSPADPGLSSAIVEANVRQTTLTRVQDVYWEQSSNGLGDGDIVTIGIFDFDWGAPTLFDTTEVCVGGEDPTGGSTIGNIIIDPNNVNRTSTECSGLPLPTGVFPAELLPTYSGQASFQETFHPLMASQGGTPVGEHALDPIVLDAGFDYGSATAPEQARFDEIDLAIVRFSDALGSIVAHEVGHALGLVPPAAPGIGLFGGQTGAEFSHAILPGGGTPPENHIMKAGNTFSFDSLAGLSSWPLPFFRPLNYAYLRDRVMTNSSIQGLFAPPAVDAVDPNVINESALLVTITGSDFSGVPVIRLLNEAFTYNCVGEAFIDENTATAWVIQSQALPGLYDLEYTDVDGQVDILPDAVTIE